MQQVRAHLRRTEGVLQLEHMQLHTDAGQQGWMPLSVYKDQQRLGKLPALIFLHATGGPAVQCLNCMNPRASLGLP